MRGTDLVRSGILAMYSGFVERMRSLTRTGMYSLEERLFEVVETCCMSLDHLETVLWHFICVDALSRRL